MSMRPPSRCWPIIGKGGGKAALHPGAPVQHSDGIGRGADATAGAGPGTTQSGGQMPPHEDTHWHHTLCL